MEYVQFGRTGVRVSPLCLGCMYFGGRTDEQESIRIIHRALDAGINFLDTANVYNRGVSEQYTGKALAGGKREQVFLATKVHGAMGDGPNDRGNSRRHIMMQVEESLRRFQTDWIDLYQIHRPDPTTPIDETLRALDDLVHQGKVRYVGCSTFPPWQIVEALWTSDKLGLAKFVSEQPPYSIFERRVEYGVLPVAQKYQIAIMPWSPLFGGWLTGKYRKGQEAPEDSRERNRRKPVGKALWNKRVAAVEKLVPIAEQKGCALTAFALAWCLAHPAVTTPIIGPRTVKQLDENLAALDVTITQEDREKVDRVVPPGTNIDGYTWIDY